MSSRVIQFDDEGEIIDKDTFKDLESSLEQQEAEDSNTLTESDEIINNTQKLFIDDEKLDYNIKSDIVFKVGEIASHFNLKEEELNRFANIYEYIHKLQFSQVVLHKSIKDQLKQKGNKIDVNRGFAEWERMLDKLSDIKMLSFLCDLIELNKEYKDNIMFKEIDKLFGQVNTINNIPKHIERNEQMERLTSLVRKISSKLK